MAMSKTKREILFSHLDKNEISYDKHYIDDTDVAFDAIEEAMEEFAEQESIAFANWLSYQKINNLPIEKLWRQYKNELK